ncbi:MAG TPA: citrate/2-methylcitrate synthase [Actinoplanes sp.]|nr:citrate/2-methylcitrate synthase [Actinoplanes sp.]
MTRQPLLTTEEVATLLGVKPATVYAYVSRGLLTSRRNADGKNSLFTRADIDAFQAGRKRATPGIQTGITLIRDGRLFFRGIEATTLARESSYESVATLLWTGALQNVPARPPHHGWTSGRPGVYERGRTAEVLDQTDARIRPDDRDQPDTRTPRSEARDRRETRERAEARERPEARNQAEARERPEANDRRGSRNQPERGDRTRAAGRHAGEPDNGPGQHDDDDVWTARPDRDSMFPIDDDLHDLAVEVTARLPATARLTDRLRVIVAAASAADPLRFDTSPTAVVATGRHLLTTMVHGLPPRAAVPIRPLPLAEALWHRLTSVPPTEQGLRALNAAMVLLADHDTAASTLAARIAASTRAHPYAVVSAGLAALDGPLHGAASGLAYQLLIESSGDPGPGATISDRQRTGVGIPGFGHPLYPAGDPRATALFDLLGDGAAKRDALRLDRTMRTRSGTAANVDLALAALALEYRMPAEAGEVIFAVARTAGWLAHALEEYGDRPMRFRPSGTYAGHQPA